MKQLSTGFFVDKTLVLTLPRRRDRLEAFYKAMPKDRGTLFSDIEVVFGCDGKRLTGAPNFTRETAGCWGCRQSHMRILEMTASHAWERVLVFEDDAEVSMIQNQLKTITDFLLKVPDDWDVVQIGYYSGKPRTSIDPSDQSVSAVCTAQRAVNMHALIYNGKSAAKIYDLVWAFDAERIEAGLPIRHIDQTLNRLAGAGLIRRYVPPRKLIHVNKRLGSDIKPYRKDPENQL